MTFKLNKLRINEQIIDSPRVTLPIKRNAIIKDELKIDSKS